MGICKSPTLPQGVKRLTMQVYNMFHRVNMHEMLMASATGPGEGEPATLRLNHPCESIDHESGTITFKNNTTAKHDMIVGADGIGVSRSNPIDRSN